jgi:hypothetical protein
MLGRCFSIRAVCSRSAGRQLGRPQAPAATALRGLCSRTRAGYATSTLDTEEQKHYYCLGVNVGKQLDNGTLDDLTPGDVEAICAGLADVLNQAEMRSVPARHCLFRPRTSTLAPHGSEIASHPTAVTRN